MLPSLASLLLALIALAAVLGLILLAQRLVRATGLVPRGSGRLSVEETLALDPRRRLHLIACEGRRVLLLTGGTADQVIGWLPGPEGRP
jgi:flagellar biogenesis protein FliO